MGRMVDIDRAEMFAQKQVLTILRENSNCQKIKAVLQLFDKHQSDPVSSLRQFYMNTDFYRFAIRCYLQQVDAMLKETYLSFSQVNWDFDELFDEFAKGICPCFLHVNKKNRGFIVYCLVVGRMAVIAHQHGSKNSSSLAVEAIMDAIKELGR